MPDDLPYLRFRPPTEVVPVASKGGFPLPKASGPKRDQQWQRLGPVLSQLGASLEQRSIELTASAAGASAEDVLVIDLAHGVDDFIEAVRNTPGMEWLAESEDEIDVSDAQGFVTRGSDRIPDRSKPVAVSLYVIATNSSALQQLLSAWRQKAAGDRLNGNLSGLAKILDHVVDIRRWDSRDRLPPEERHLWEAQLPEDTTPFRFEIEFWFRRTPELRNRAEAKLSEIIESTTGRILNRFIHEGCRYHGLCVEIPANQVRGFLDHPEASTLLEDESIYHLWLTGQAVAKPGEVDEGEEALPLTAALPQLEPEVALFDGMPMENHPLLQDRLIIHDPDGFGDDYPAANRDHGTSMASIIVHGDRQASGVPLSRRLYVRPIMRPDPSGPHERIPDHVLPLDLIYRAVLELMREAPSVKVVNLSIGDQARPFSGAMSAWARMLDWLQAEYNILFIISAGNADECPSSFETSIAFEDASNKELERDIMDTKWRNMRDFRILSPAESINALSIGATSADAGPPTQEPPGARNPIISAEIPAHASRIGPGFRKSVKPDFLISGGRELVRWVNHVTGSVTETITQQRQPGIKVAGPPHGMSTNREIHTRGTSAAAAMATRRCAFIFDALRLMDERIRPPEDFFPVLAKSLSVHGACWRDGGNYLEELLPDRRAELTRNWKKRLLLPMLGHGVVAHDDLMLGNDFKVTLLAWGTARAGDMLEYQFPLPSATHGRRGRKRLTCTTAWFTPINPANARYRHVKLSLSPPPDSETSLLGVSRRNGDANATKRGTVHHEVFEGITARGHVDENPFIPLHLKCSAEAGEWDEHVRYGIAVTLEVAGPVFGQIYEEIGERLGIRVPVRST